MTKFEPLKKNPGELIRSEDWNKIQEDVKTDLEMLENEIRILRDYIDRMAKSVTLTNLESPVGSSYRLNEVLPGDVGDFATNVIGYITSQWVLGKEQVGVICRFGVLDYFDILYYWAGASLSEKGCLEITLEYVDGTIHSVSDLFLHDWTQLRVQGDRNPFIEYLLSPNERVWYKYEIKNPNPDKEVRYISFKDVDEENSPRIGNVIQHVARIRPV
ncbi:hypothetical protein ACFL0D_08040 [Thermoproteota archaeon]